MSSNYRAHILLFTTSLIQGFNFTVAKIVMEYISPAALIVIRGIAAVLFFWLIHRLLIREEIKSIRDFSRIFLCSVTGIAVNQLLFYKGLSLTQPINASLMVTITPVMVLIISAAIIKEAITLRKITGILLGAAGVIALLLSSSEKGPETLFIGDLLILINAISYAIFLVLVKPLMTKYHPVTILKWMFFLGLFMVTPFGFEGLLAVEWETMPTNAALSLAFVIFFATLVTYTLNVGVMKVVNPSLAGIYIYLQPLMAAVIAVSFGIDVLTVKKVAFSVLIFTGVYLVSKEKK